MPATSEARVIANRQNALKSSGPKTDEGKARSRSNAIKHGLTGEGIALSPEDAAEVERRVVAFEEELKPSGEVGRALARRAALMSVRMDRCVEQETAAITARVRSAIDEFEAPEGLELAEAEQLRHEAGRRALFDPSKEACLARKYEAAAERAFFRALKELRQLDRSSKAEPLAAPVAQASAALGSFLQEAKRLAPRPTTPPKPTPLAPSTAVPAVEPAWNPPLGDSFFVPIAIGRPR